MKKTLFTLLMLCCMTAAVKAQGQTIVQHYHKKLSSTELTPESSPEDAIAFFVKSSGGNCSLVPGMTPKYYGQGTDDYGNVHTKYYLENDRGQMTYYQIFLHFRPDGTLYYINGVLPLLDLSAPAKSMIARMKIPAERASLIAMGNTTSEVSQTVVTYKGEPRHAYMVKDPGSLKDVYVDVYSGEVLYTIPHVLSFSPWSDVHGTNVNVQGNTMFNGMQQMDVMQTTDGYILRDPVRNIITVDATGKYKDLPKEEFPEPVNQLLMLASSSDDFVYNDEQLQTSQYAAAIRSIILKYTPNDPAVGMPSSTSIRAYYSDDDDNPLGEIFTTNNATWTKNAAGEYECKVCLPEPVSVDLLHTHHIVEFNIDNIGYTLHDVMIASEDSYLTYEDDDGSSLEFMFDIVADAMQPALDIHWSIQKAYDMYDTYFGVKGSDGKGSQLVNIVNPSNNVPFIDDNGLPFNACALNGALPDPYNNDTFYMFYGMGGVIADYKPLVELPIIAHEYTHTVTAGSGGGLMPQNEPGALNEATADCMAMVVEDFALGQPSWTIGRHTSIFSANMRDMKDPWYSGCVDGKIDERRAQPKYYGGRYWLDYNADPKTDNGGVHMNDGVFNYLFYLLCEGAYSITNEVGQTHTIEPLGMDAMKDIVFHSMMFYNSALCDYAEIADNLMIAVEDIVQQDESLTKKFQERMSVAYQHVGMKTSFDPTGITTVASDIKSPYSGTYNLYGMPVDSSYKGVVIKNGKKVLVK